MIVRICLRDFSDLIETCFCFSSFNEFIYHSISYRKYDIEIDVFVFQIFISVHKMVSCTRKIERVCSI